MQDNEEEKKESVEENKEQENNKIDENSELEKIKQEINKQKKLPKEIVEKVSKKVFINVVIAISIVIYFIFINLGYININKEAFITDLQVFSIALIITTVIIFEKAYKKDSGKLTIYGIELLILSIITMLLPRIYNQYTEIFVEIVGISSIAYVVYYLIKCIIIYAKTRRKIRKSDVKKIAKK